MEFRKFQVASLRAAQDIRAGIAPVLFVADVYPGSGKSAIPVIFAKELLGELVQGRRIEHLCWVVPRLALQDQAVDAFLDPFFRKLLGHEYKIRQSTNDVRPSRNLAGHVTTYQAINANPTLLQQEFRRSGYLLILDEPHHVVEGGEYERALRPLFEAAVVTVLQSGTLYRASRREAIAFLPYDRQGNVRQPISKSDGRAIYMQYPLEEALGERPAALKHLEFELLDTGAEWREQPGASSTVSVPSLLGLDDEQRGNALFVALRSEFADQLLAQCVRHWLGYRERVESAKLLVVAATQPLARDYLRELRRTLGVTRVDIAISDETAAAKVNIDKFRLPVGDAGALDALVTVGMAYEGLDVPSITHLACLTHIRSLGWITQMLARAQRIDRNSALTHGEQRGFVFAPRDDFFDDIVAMIKHAQSVQQIIDVQPTQNGGGNGHAGFDPVIPVGSNRNEVDVVIDTADQSLTVERLAYLRDLMEQHSWHGFSALELDAVLRDHDARRAARTAAEATATAAQAASVAQAAKERRPNDRENELRTAIQSLCNKLDREQNLPPGTSNGQLLTRYRKPRAEMTIEELEAVYAYVRKVWSDGSAAAD